MAKQYVKLPPLEIEPALYNALNQYATGLGVPRARVIRDILRSFLGPIVTSPRLANPSPEEELVA